MIGGRKQGKIITVSVSKLNGGKGVVALVLRNPHKKNPHTQKKKKKKKKQSYTWEKWIAKAGGGDWDVGALKKGGRSGFKNFSCGEFGRRHCGKGRLYKFFKDEHLSFIRDKGR